MTSPEDYPQNYCKHLQWKSSSNSTSCYLGCHIFRGEGCPGLSDGA